MHKQHEQGEHAKAQLAHNRGAQHILDLPVQSLIDTVSTQATCLDQPRTCTAQSLLVPVAEDELHLVLCTTDGLARDAKVVLEPGIMGQAVGNLGQRWHQHEVLVCHPAAQQEEQTHHQGLQPGPRVHAHPLVSELA